MDESGATTAEYTVGTLGAVSVAALLVKLGLDPWFTHVLWDLIQHALDPNVFLDHVGSLPRLLRK